MGKVEEAILFLSGRCDGATSVDGMGWNKMDSGLGKSLATRIERGLPLTPNQKAVVYRMLPKYHRQFPNWPEIESELVIWKDIDETPSGYTQRPPAGPQANDTTFPRLEYRGRKFYILTRRDVPSDRALVNSIPGGKWVAEEKAWRYMDKDITIQELLRHRGEFGQISPEAVNRLLEWTESQKRREEQAQNVKAIKANQVEGEVNLPLKNWTYRPHQVRAFQIGTTLERVALFMEQRTGKTPVTVAILGHRFLQGQIKRVLIVSPLSVMGGWKKDGFKKMADYPNRVQILEGKVTQRKATLNNWQDTEGELQVVIVNYDVIFNLFEDLKAWKPDAIVIDEGHKIKKGTKQRSKAMHKLGKGVRYKILLTGTPINQAPLDIHSQFRFMDDAIFGNNFADFRNRYCVMGGYGGYEVLGYRILETLKDGSPNPYYIKHLADEYYNKVHNVSFRITREEVDGLPPVEPQNLYTRLEPSALKVYREMERESIVNLEGQNITAPIVLTRVLRLQQITGGFFQAEDESIIQVSKAKMNTLFTKLDELFEDDKKVVVFARFTPEIKAISAGLASKGISHRVLDGSVKRVVRDLAIEDFQTKPEVKVFVVQISAGGEGITLDAADATIFYSANFSLIDYEQATARIMAMNQSGKEVFNIIAEDTVDEGVFYALSNKKDISRMIMDDPRSLFRLREEGDIRKGAEEMAKVVGKEAREVALTEKGYPNDADELTSLLDELENELKEKGALSQRAPRIITINDQTGDNNKSSAKSDTKAPKKKVLTDDDVVTLKSLASEMDMEPKRLRKWLRGHYGQTEGRWEWAPDDPQLKEIREALNK